MIATLDQITNICESLRKEGKKIVFTNGCFDLLHLGHISYLKKAKALGDTLIIGLNSDDSVRRLKGNNRPILLQNERAEILDSLKPVDFVVIFEDDTPEKLIRIIKPDFLVKGGDYKIDEIAGATFVRSYGGKVVLVPFIEGKSTSKLIQKIKDN